MKIKKINLLDNINKLRLNSMFRKCNFKKDSYKYKKADSSLDTQIAIDKINSENLKLQAVNNSMQNKIDNARMKCRLSQIERAIDFNNSIADNEKKEIKNTIKKSKKFKRCSFWSGVISALTTCFGLYNQSETVYVETFAFQVIAILAACFFVNIVMNEGMNFKDKFFNSTKSDVVVLIFILIITAAYSTYSIYTNFDFWKRYFNGPGLLLFSVIFDGISILMSILYNIYGSLRYNDEYKNEINKVLETPGEEKENNKVIDIKKNSTKAV